MYKYEDYRQQVLEDPDTYIRVKSIALSRIGANGVIRALDIIRLMGAMRLCRPPCGNGCNHRN